MRFMRLLHVFYTANSSRIARVQQSKHADAPLMETEKSFAYLPGF
jgi:hypothetical protein